MQVFNSFQEMATGTGALGTQSTMSVFNAMPSFVHSKIKSALISLEYGMPQALQRAVDLGLESGGSFAEIKDAMVDSGMPDDNADGFLTKFFPEYAQSVHGIVPKEQREGGLHTSQFR